MKKRFIGHVIFDCAVIFPAIIGGFYLGNEMLTNVAYFVFIVFIVLGLIVGPTLMATKDETLKDSVKRKSKLHSAYSKLSTAAEVLLLVALGHPVLGALYMISSVLVVAGTNKVLEDDEELH